jgi:predicted RNase H-like HicB family nuclease
MSAMPNVQDAVKLALGAGLCVVPPREDGSKAPDVDSWTALQQSPPNVRQINDWYRGGDRTGVGIITGRVSQLVELFEFDNRETYEAFCDTGEAAGWFDLIERIRGGYMEVTPGGGVHWLYRCEATGRSTKLARRPGVDADGKPTAKPLIETKGEGGYVVIAPSHGGVHPTGRAYELVSGNLDSIATITAAERDALFEIARAFDEMPKPVADFLQHDISQEHGERPGDDYNRRARWEDVLQPHGWTRVYHRNGVTYWRRPGKDRGISASTNFAGSDLLYVWSSSQSTFEIERGYAKWRAYALLEHGGDFSAAARALRKAGYGADTTLKRLVSKGLRPISLNGEHEPAEALATPENSTPVDFEDFYAYMPEHKYMFIPTRELWPAPSVNGRLMPQPTGRMKENGKPEYKPASWWLDKDRPVEQMTWAPGRDMVIVDQLLADGGWINREGCTTFNLYRGPVVSHGDATRAGRWIEHVHKLYPSEAEHIITWLAHRVQRPGEKINHALVLGGQQGIGKDTLLDPVRQAVGPWNVSEVSPVQLIGRFNGFIRSVILRVSEARDLGDVDRYAFYEHLKVYTAAPPDVLRCDEKNMREYSVLNVCGVVITTNHKTDGIYLPADDRRHFVAWSDLQMTDFAEEYWITFYDWLERGGYGHVAAYLATLDLSDFNPKAPPPKTAAFWSIVDANRAPEDAELADVLDGLSNPAAITVEGLAYHADENLRTWLLDRKSRRQLPHRMEGAGYVPVRNDGASDGLWKIGKRRRVVYARRELNVRDRIAAAQELMG